MNQFIESVRMAIHAENWHAALMISLTLPDICSRLESEDDRTNGIRYAAWFDKYLKGTYTMTQPVHHVFMTGDDCYVLRCSMLHQGIDDVAHQKKKGVLDKFHFTTLPAHRIQVDKALSLNVQTFCFEILAAVGNWMSDFMANHPDKHYKLDEMITIYDESYAFGGVRIGQPEDGV